MIGSIVHQLTRNMKDAQYMDPAFAPYFVDHTAGIYPASAAGTPWSAATMQVKGDPMADLVEDMAAEQTPEYRLHPCYAKNENNPKSRCSTMTFRILS